jgi:hypothetical protein
MDAGSIMDAGKKGCFILLLTIKLTEYPVDSVSPMNWDFRFAPTSIQCPAS